LDQRALLSGWYPLSKAEMSKIELRSELTLFDVTNLVVGAIIGADIYVASAFGAGYLGPSSLLVWIVSGVIAIVIALCFAQCVALLPKVGGPYAYAKEAWGPFAGFLVGWSLWLAEWISLAVFPVAFTQYLMFFLPDLGWMQQVIVKVLFVALLATTNIIGVRAAGRTNDVLTVVKLVPLVFFSGIGLLYILFHSAVAASNFSPFFPYGLDHFGTAVVLIFWAYAGFEISTIPADEIRDPGTTIPKAIVLGISIVTIFYLVTNAVLFGVRSWNQLASDTAPLTSATTAMLGTNTTLSLVGVAIVGVGALISVTGSDESGMIGTSRLGYALAADGLFPRIFAKVHPRFKTPHLAIGVQAITALIASIVGNLSMLIASSVFFMAIAYLASSASIFSLRRSLKPRFQLRGSSLVPILGIAFSLYLISQCTITQIIVGLILLFVGVPLYVKYSPKKEITELKEQLISRDSVLKRAYAQEGRFLAHALRHLKTVYRRITGKKQTWIQVD
jgi:APA family basic amino acid/polyamine antiporter